MASFREQLTLAAYALRAIVTTNTTGAAGGPVVPLHGISDDQGNHLGIAAAPVITSDAGMGSDGSSPPALPGGATGVRGWLRYLASLVAAAQPRAIASNAPSVSAAGTLANSGDVIALALDGMNTAVVQAAAGAWTGSAIFEASADNGASYTPVNMIPYAGGASTGAATPGGLWEMAVGGLTHVRVRATTAIASGPASLALRATNGLKSLRVGAPTANPVPTSTPTPATFFVKRIVMTGSPIQLPSNVLANGLVLTAAAGNTSPIFYGPSAASVTAIDGTGDGYPIAAGGSASDAIANSNAGWVNGAAGTAVYIKGN